MFDTRTLRHAARICAFFPLAASISGVSAQDPRVNIGTLTCTVADAPTQPAQPQTAVGEERAMRCVYRSARGDAEQTYSGTIKRAGTDRLLDAKLVMMWAVWGPAAKQSEPGALAQTYVGQSDADKTSTASSGLVGQSDSSYALQAATPSGETDSAVTVVDLKLQSVPA